MESSNNLSVVCESSAVGCSLSDLPIELAKKVKMADPSIWPLLKTTHEIKSAVEMDWEALGDDIGMIVVGNAYPKQCAEKVIHGLETKGRFSPLSFINANAGAAISICCTLNTFHGPTMNFTASDNLHIDMAKILAKHWLTQNDAQYLFLARMDFDESGECLVTNQLLSLAA